jgi:hypothetical protein
VKQSALISHRLVSLAKDLYTLSDNPPYEQQVGQEEMVETCRLVEAAWNNKDWALVLELLRERPYPYPPVPGRPDEGGLLVPPRRSADIAALSSKGPLSGARK